MNDLAWDAESKRIVAVGAGKERSGHAFLYDTLSSVGEITGHNKPINCVALRPGRPWRAVTGSDDATLNFHTGVPYRFSHSISSHSRFVQCVEYAPAGTADIFASCGSDGLVYLLHYPL